MSNDVLITGNLVVQGTANGNSHINNDNAFTINSSVLENSFLKGTAAATVGWNTMQARFGEGGAIAYTNTNAFPTTNIRFGQGNGSGSGYYIKLPTGNSGSNFLFSKRTAGSRFVRDPNDVQILDWTIGNNRTSIFSCLSGNAYCWWIPEGVNPT